MARVAARVTLAYLVIGGLWILLSDRVVSAFVTDPSLSARLQTFKGWAFVLVTGLALYLLLYRHALEVERSQTALRESQRFLSTVMSNLQGMVYRCRNDRSWTMEFVSEGCQELTGYEPSDLIANRTVAASSLIHPKDAERVWDEVQRGLQDKKPFQASFRINDARGNEKWVWAQGRGVKPDHIEGFITDITAQRLLEEKFYQAQKMEAVGRLAGGIAHDFNNLLGVIIGYGELLLERLKPADPMFKRVGEIKKAGDRAASLTRQLLAFSRKQVLEPRVLDLNNIVTDLVRMLQRLIGEDIKLTVITGAGLGLVKVDPGQFEQVIMNLAVNARDAMPRGGQLTIETANIDLNEEYARRHPVVPPGHYVMLAVGDTGVGMDAVTQTRIFEPFFTTKEHGTGLGLATVYGIVKQSGGYIWVYSELARGTTFKVYLPRVGERVSPVEEHAGLGDHLRGAETILLVEDAEGIRGLAAESLRSRGYTVVEATDAPEALAAAERHRGPIHLLLTDVVLPGKSGRELARELVAKRPEARVLYMSGYTDETIVHHGVLEPGLAFLQKPFTLYGLASKVREVLGRSQSQS